MSNARHLTTITTFFSLRTSRRARRGFTLVEMLVVVSILTLLIAILLPALGGVQRRSRKAAELNFIKQLGHAWMLYGNNNNDAALPGFLDKDVQANWKVRYDFPNRTRIPPAPNPPAMNYSGDNMAGPWTWRLLSYLEHNQALVHGYLNEDPIELTRLNLTDSPADKLMKIAYEPAFGYNGFYIGGYWDQWTTSAPNVQDPHFRYYNHRRRAGSQYAERLSMPTSIAQISRSDRMVTFCSSAKFTDAQGVKSRLPADHPGAHLVMPPTVEQTARWRPAPNEVVSSVEVLSGGEVYVPLIRHTNTVAVLWADGHVEATGYQSLFDQRLWINNADDKNYMHSE